MKQKLIESQKSPGVRTVWRDLCPENSIFPGREHQCPETLPQWYRTTKGGRTAKFLPLWLQGILLDESIWWKKAAPSETMSCQVASNPERNQAHPKHQVPPESPMQRDTPADPKRKPEVYLQLWPDPTEWNSSTSPDHVCATSPRHQVAIHAVKQPTEWPSDLPQQLKGHAGGLDWHWLRIWQSNQSFTYPYYSLQGRPRQESPSW